MHTGPGIYRIDGPNGKFYVGSAKGVSRRLIVHRRDLRRGVHANPKLQRAWGKYGEQAFSYSLLEALDDVTRLIEREQFWIDSLEAVKHGYNLRSVAHSNAGLIPSDETKRKMSAAHLGRKHGPMSAEQKAKLSAALKGRKLPEEQVRKMTAARVGIPRSQECKEKVSRARKGKPLSVEHKEALRQAHLGKKASEETKERMRRAARLHYAVTPDHPLRISNHH